MVGFTWMGIYSVLGISFGSPLVVLAASALTDRNSSYNPGGVQLVTGGDRTDTGEELTGSDGTDTEGEWGISWCCHVSDATTMVNSRIYGVNRVRLDVFKFTNLPHLLLNLPRFDAPLNFFGNFFEEFFDVMRIPR